MRTISYYLIFGKPLIMYTGILTLILLLATALIGFLLSKGKIKIRFFWHKWLALATVISGLIHALMGLSLYF